MKTNLVDLGSGSQREIDDIMLTRFACYLIVQNGDQDLFNWVQRADKGKIEDPDDVSTLSYIIAYLTGVIHSAKHDRSD